MVPPDSHKDTYSVVLGILLGVIEISHTRLSLSLVGNSMPFCYFNHSHNWSPATPHQTPCGASWGLGFCRFAHRYLGNLVDFSSSPYLDVSVQVVSTPHSINSPKANCFARGSPIKSEGFPHSDTAGSKLRGSSPTTIATMYVLLR